MKKIVCLMALLLSIAMVFGMLQVFAASNVAVKVETVTLDKTGKTAEGGYYTVSVPINITENTGFMSIMLSVAYDENFELVGWSEGTVFPYDQNQGEGVSGTDGLPASGNYSAHNATSPRAEDFVNPFTICYVRPYEANNTATGTLITLNFKVPEDTATGEYPITVTVEEAFSQSGTIGGEEGTAIPDLITNACSATAGAIKVSNGSATVRPGDVDGNGVVNLTDVARLKQYFARWDVTINQANADADGNGVVNLSDVARLNQYFARWDVQLGK